MLGGSRLRPAPERRRWGFGPLLGLLVVAGVCTAAAAPVQVGLGVARGVITAPISGGNTDAAAAARLRQVRTLLDRRSTALLRHDRTGWLAGVDPAATGLRTRQAELLANIAAVPLGVWRYTLEPGDETGRVERGGSWTVRVTLHYTLR